MLSPAPMRTAFADPVVLLLLYIVGVSAFFFIFPSADLWATGLFYDPATGFPAAKSTSLAALRKSQDWIIGAMVTGLAVVLVAALVAPGRLRFVSPRGALFLVASLVVGPGLLVNGLLKDHWGRPRPAFVADFGGAFPYVDVWRISDYCRSNCSFVSGEASSAVWLMAASLIVPRRYRVPVLALTGGYALVISIGRMAAGRHFLSDVMLAWGLTGLVVFLAYRLICPNPSASLAGPPAAGGPTAN